MAACVAAVVTYLAYCQLPEWYWSLLWLQYVVDLCPPPPPYIIHMNEISDTYQISPWYHSAVLSADPQAYNLKSNSDRVPTIQIDLASPQSPDSASTIDEFTHASKQQEEDQGLMMKPPAGPRGTNQSGEADGSREQQKLMRCLSDPGPSADEDEDEPFLPWSSEAFKSGSGRVNNRTRKKIKGGITSRLCSINSKLVPKISQSCKYCTHQTEVRSSSLFNVF